MDWPLILENALQAAVGQNAIIFALAAVGLNVHFGYTGLLNFGQVAFVACGAYGLAISVASYGLSFGTGLLVGLAAAGLLAVLLGIPTLRLRADYLAIVTIAAGEIIRFVLRSPQYDDRTGGSNGLQNFAGDFVRANPLVGGRLRFGTGVSLGPLDWHWFDISVPLGWIHDGNEYGFWVLKFGERTTWLLACGWFLVGVCSLLVFLLMRSPWGRVLRAIREDEDAARSLGKNVDWYKMQSLVLGGLIGAIAGFVFAIANQSVQPDNYGTAFTFIAYTALILGGTARVLGPVVGAMIFWFLLQLTDVALRQAINAGYIADTVLSGTEVGQVRQVLVGLGLVLLVVFRPQGVLGDRREMAASARR